MTQDLDNLKSFLRDYVETVTQRSKSGLYNCPLCPSGTGKNRTGAFGIFDNGRRWKCQACSKHGDIFDLYAEINRCDLSEATRAIIDMYGTHSATRSSAREDFKPMDKETTSGTANDKQQPTPAYADAIARYNAALDGSPAQSYLQGRGLTLDTMKRFHLGYNKQRQTVTIPYNPQGSYYGQRSINPNTDRKHDNLTGVPIPLFNPAALYSSDVCFVVESPLCAISIEQEGGTAVAISGTSGGSRLYAQLKKKPTEAALVLCFDNDEAGRKATDTISAELESNFDVFVVNGTAAIMGTETDPAAEEYRKDPNDVLQHSGAEALRIAIEETIEATIQARAAVVQEADAERQQRTGAGMVDSFLEAVQTHKYEPLPTGIGDIDRAIGGGFIRGQVILLGAAPGAGKTALAQWIFEGYARRGTDCVYLNLEMSREQVLARSFARIAAKNGVKIRTTDVLQGYKWTDIQRAAIMEAAEEYKQSIAPHMIYNPDGVSANLDTILAYIEKEAQRAEKAGTAAPLCVLDYLQLVGGQPREDVVTVIKRAMDGLKRYAMQHNTVVFVIMAHNRASNSTGAVSMESGRDTSALEYGADLQLALTYTKSMKRADSKDKPIAPDDLTEEQKRYVTLKAVKGRWGGVGRYADLYFEGETMTYKQLATEFIEVNEETPWSGKTVAEF